MNLYKTVEMTDERKSKNVSMYKQFIVHVKKSKNENPGGKEEKLFGVFVAFSLFVKCIFVTIFFFQAAFLLALKFIQIFLFFHSIFLKYA